MSRLNKTLMCLFLLAFPLMGISQINGLNADQLKGLADSFRENVNNEKIWQISFREINEGSSQFRWADVFITPIKISDQVCKLETLKYNYTSDRGWFLFEKYLSLTLKSEGEICTNKEVSSFIQVLGGNIYPESFVQIMTFLQEFNEYPVGFFLEDNKSFEKPQMLEVLSSENVISAKFISDGCEFSVFFNLGDDGMNVLLVNTKSGMSCSRL